MTLITFYRSFYGSKFSSSLLYSGTVMRKDEIKGVLIMKKNRIQAANK